MDSDEMRHFTKNFSFDKCKKGNQGFNRILIQLFGLLGNGKSSFINTCIYVWKDCEFENWAKARGEDGGSTTDRIPYELTENLTLVDNRGCRTLEDKESGVIFAQLGNLLPIDTRVEWGEGFGLTEKMVRAEKLVKTSDFVFPVFVNSVRKGITKEERGELEALLNSAMKLTGHLLPLGSAVEWSKGFGLVERIVRAEKIIETSDFIVPVFIYSVKTGVHPTEADEIKHLLHTAAKLTGIYPIVVLTYKTSGSLTDTIAAFRDMGAEKIFAFENYTLEDCDKTRGRHEEVLKFLSEVIEEAIFQIDHSRDPEREMKERKQFVLNYVHEREKKLQEDKVERHKVQEKAIKVTQLRKEEETMEKLRKREEMEMEEEVRRKQEEMERMNLVDQARREAEIRAQRASKDKKKKWYGRLFH
ncbi:uncharacterized protein [Ranitomeya imitator]|uniref:uncharacterized protein isoform X1 n=1 Tax=Ranitomeya imitator TaxID=111125 RepID=UPI0037E92BC3